MKKIASVLAVLLAIVVVLVPVFRTSVYADTQTNVVMTYNDKTLSKVLYGVDTDQIKLGIVTEGLKSIGALCDNLVYTSNGSIAIDKDSVMQYVMNSIIAGSTNVAVDLTQYTPEAVANRKAASLASAAGALTTDTSANNIVATAGNNDLLLNATLNSMGIDCKIAEASTKFNPNQDRAVNVRNAASKINGTILYPGQGMSATNAFGPRTVANGYGMGNVISGGGYIKALGGGICQVSSTLNLAVLRAGIIPTVRHNHSHRSNYIASGLDATISGTALDYQFVNTLAYPIYIMTNSDGGVLTVSIYSNHDALGGIVYEPTVVGGKLSNSTYLIGTFNGVEVSNRYCYKSVYSQ